MLVVYMKQKLYTDFCISTFYVTKNIASSFYSRLVQHYRKRSQINYLTYLRYRPPPSSGGALLRSIVIIILATFISVVQIQTLRGGAFEIWKSTRLAILHRAGFRISASAL